MSKAKKYIFISILVMTFLMFSFCLFALNRGIALADDETQYYYIPQDTLSKTATSSSVYFVYQGDNLFKIPESYYLKIVGEATAYDVPVSYKGLVGTISKEKADTLAKKTTTQYSNTAINDDNAYPNIELTFSGATLSFEKLDGNTETKDPTLIHIYYLGKSDDNTKTYIKVVEGDTTFYGSTTAQFATYTVSANQEVINFINSQESGSSSNQPNTNNSKALRVILIIGLIIPAVIIALLIFIPKKSEQYDKARMNSRKVGKIDYDKTRMQDPNMQQPPYQQNGYNQYPPQNYGGPQYPNYQQPQYPPQNNGYYPPQNNVYYPPQDNGYYPPQNNGYFDPNDPNGGMQWDYT